MKKLIISAVAILGLLACSSSASAQTNPGTYVSTLVRVNAGAAEKAEFCFGPASSPCIGQTVVFFNYPDNTWQVIFNYDVFGKQASCFAHETYQITRSADPDHDSNQLTSVIMLTADNYSIGPRTITLVSSSFQSEQVGMHDQNETLGGSATLTIQ